jgi:hypothetical protein
MKDIMAAESSSSDQGVPSFTFCPSDEKFLNLPLEQPLLDQLETSLLNEFAGKSLSMINIFNNHHVGKPYIERNYRDALINLESAGIIITNPPADKRQKRKGKLTFAHRVIVNFPKGSM